MGPSKIRRYISRGSSVGAIQPTSHVKSFLGYEVKSGLLQVFASSSVAVAVAGAKKASMVGLPSCLPHRCSHDYKLLIQRGGGEKGERGGYRPRATATGTLTLRRMAARVSMRRRPHDGIIQLANIEVRKEGRNMCGGRWVFEPLSHIIRPPLFRQAVGALGALKGPHT